MFIPFNVDVPMQRWPLMNWAIIAVTVLISMRTLAGGEDFSGWMVIGPGDDFTLAGLFGSLVTHLDFMHLLGNMVFLFVFGNAINAKIGHAPFVLCYVSIGLVGGLAWALLADGPAAGASGAIMGVIGMFVVFYPRNDVSVWYWVLVRMGTFSVSAYVLIAVYIAFDLYGLLSGGEGVAYLAHLAGFAAGFGIASGLVLAGLYRSEPYEQNLYELLGVR